MRASKRSSSGCQSGAYVISKRLMVKSSGRHQPAAGGDDPAGRRCATTVPARGRLRAPDEDDERGFAGRRRHRRGLTGIGAGRQQQSHATQVTAAAAVKWRSTGTLRGYQRTPCFHSNSIGLCGSRADLLDRHARGRLLLTGADRRSYLQGLLTNDIEALSAGDGLLRRDADRAGPHDHRHACVRARRSRAARSAGAARPAPSASSSTDFDLQRGRARSTTSRDARRSSGCTARGCRHPRRASSRPRCQAPAA